VCAIDMDCADMNPCTTHERCDPVSRICQFLPLDGDGDGYPPLACGGTDCDDSRASVHPGATEVCNARDDSCNGIVDEAPAGVECGTGFLCVSGSCACPSGQHACGRACVDWQTSRANCGACYRSCGSMGTCVGGNCNCPSGTTFCEGLGCISVQADNSNCGSCGNHCDTGFTCQSGGCICGAGRAVCGGRCIDVLSNAYDCGTCGNVCPPGISCSGGVCQCPGGRVACGGACVDLQSDSYNCGHCGTVCGATPRGDAGVRQDVSVWTDVYSGGDAPALVDRSSGVDTGPPVDRSLMCIAGSCGCGTRATSCMVSGTYHCIDTQTDLNNCGSCGNVCPYPLSCVYGTCACAGTMGRLCSGTCRDLASDPANCGSCGNACIGGTICSGGACVCAGPMGRLCSGTCRDLGTDIANCGVCGNACATGASCSSGVCVCPATTARVCGGVCRDLSNDVANCGSCGNACPAAMVAHASSVCLAGSCAVSCDSGWTDCNHDMADGCEANLSSDISNCGGCGRMCGSSIEFQGCEGGMCCAPESHTCGFGGAACCAGLRCRSHGTWSQCDR
jgi:hypothetical protein